MKLYLSDIEFGKWYLIEPHRYFRPKYIDKGIWCIQISGVEINENEAGNYQFFGCQCNKANFLYYTQKELDKHYKEPHIITNEYLENMLNKFAEKLK